MKMIQIVQMGGCCMAKAFSSKRDVYIEIAARYEKFIRLGVISIGEKLPSVRVAAGELGVNPNTVQRAYCLLEEQGFIRSMPKKGAYVIFDQSEDKQEPTSELVGLISDLKNSGVSKSKILSAIEEVYGND